MADLSSALQANGYDLIDGQTRNQKILQIWRRRAFNAIEPAYEDVKHAITSPVNLQVISDPSVAVVSKSSQDFQFNIGLSFLKNILEKIGAGKAAIETKITSGNKMEISFDKAFSETVMIGELIEFFRKGDFSYLNENMYKDLKRDNLFIISGVIYAQNLKVKIESSQQITADLKAEIIATTDGKLAIENSQEGTIQLTADLGLSYPIAVKYNQIKFGHGKFKDVPLVSDTKEWF